VDIVYQGKSSYFFGFKRTGDQVVWARITNTAVHEFKLRIRKEYLNYLPFHHHNHQTFVSA
jgi:hypothetical protein